MTAEPHADSRLDPSQRLFNLMQGMGRGQISSASSQYQGSWPNKSGSLTGSCHTVKYHHIDYPVRL